MQEQEKRTFGYARVSSKSQNVDRQIDALREHGVLERDIYIDKASGKNFDRPKYADMKGHLREGDTVMVLDLDRLGRNYDEMATEWRAITKDKKCDIVIINYPLLSTVGTEADLDKRFLADMVFGLLSYVAERERKEIRERQREGIESAKRNNKKFGRPTIEKPQEFATVFGRVQAHEITNKQAMKLLGLKPNTYYKFIREERGS